MKSPSEKAWRAALHTLQYAYDNKEHGINFRSDGNRVPVVYYDSGHKQQTGDGKSFYFFVIFHYGGPVYWETRKHELPAYGAGEDEYMTQAHACKWALGYRHLLAELGYDDMVAKPWDVVGDNAQAEGWAREWAMMTINSRHIQQKYHIVKHMVKAGWFRPLWQSGLVNPADAGTKPLDGAVSARLNPMLEGRRPLPPVPEPLGVLKRSGVDSAVLAQLEREVYCPRDEAEKRRLREQSS